MYVKIISDKQQEKTKTYILICTCNATFDIGS